MQSKQILVLGLIFLLSGCSQPLKTLMAVDAEQTKQHLYVENREASFQRLLKDLGTGQISNGIERGRIVFLYGEPVLVETVKSVGEMEARERLLYRHPTKFFNTAKVYLDFNEQGQLVSSRIENPLGAS